MNSEFGSFLTKLCNFLAALEDAAAELRQQIVELASIPEWDMKNIKWEPAEGPSGPYERSEDVNSRDFKALLKELAMHGGKMRVGDFFMWTFKNGTVIGRKKCGSKADDPFQHMQNSIKSLKRAGERFEGAATNKGNGK